MGSVTLCSEDSIHPNVLCAQAAGLDDGTQRERLATMVLQGLEDGCGVALRTFQMTLE